MLTHRQTWSLILDWLFGVAVLHLLGRSRLQMGCVDGAFSDDRETQHGGQ